MAMVSLGAVMVMAKVSLVAAMGRASLEKEEGCSGEVGEMPQPAGVALSASH